LTITDNYFGTGKTPTEKHQERNKFGDPAKQATL